MWTDHPVWFTMKDLGKGHAPLLIFSQTEAQKAKKKFFKTPPLPPPPYRKICMRHWFNHELFHLVFLFFMMK